MIEAVWRKLIEFERVFDARLDFVRRHGICAYDQAQALCLWTNWRRSRRHRCVSGQAEGANQQVIESLSKGWLANRRHLNQMTATWARTRRRCLRSIPTRSRL